MRNIGKVFRSDIRRMTSSVVAVVVVMGLCLIPCLYAWFNILSNWDPYGPNSTSNIKVAVANSDEGCELLGLRLNIGELVMAGLKDNDQMGWVFLDSRQEALDGVEAGDYYAALIVPEEFTGDFLSVLDGELRHPQIEYYENEKKNAIAPKITGKAKTAVQEQINSTIMEKVADAVNAVGSILRAMGLDADDISEKLVKGLDGACADLADLSTLLRSVDELLGDTGSVLNYSALVVDDTGKVMLSAGDTVAAVGGAVSAGSSALGGMSGNMEIALDSIDKHVASIIATLTGDGNDEQRGQNIKNLLQELENGLSALRAGAPKLSQLDAAAGSLAAMQQLTGSLDSVSGRNDMQSLAGQLRGGLNAMTEQCAGMQNGLNGTKAQISGLKELLLLWEGSEENMLSLAEMLNNIQLSLDGAAALDPAPAPSLESAYAELARLREWEQSGADAALTEQMLSSADNIDAVLNSVNEYLGSCTAQISSIDSSLGSLESELRAMNSLGLEFLDGELSFIESQLEDVKSRHPELSGLMDAALKNVSEMRQLIGSVDLPDVREQIAAKAAEIQEIIRTAALKLNDNVTTHIQNSASKVQEALNSIRDMLAASAGELGGISQTLGAYSQALGQSQNTVAAAIGLADLVQGYLASIADDVRRITSSEAFRQLIDVIENNPDGVAEYLSSPVKLNSVIVYEISDYGSAMSPYYIMLALFVGSLLAATMIKVPVRADDLYDLRAGERFFGRYQIFFCIGMAQALVTSLGCLYYVGIQCLHPGLFILACCICSLNFTLMNYSLVYALDNIGMGAAVIIMVIQVAGSGGSYPIHVLPPVFQKLYPYMPFHYGMDMIRETIGGMYGNTYARCALILLGMCLLFIAFGLLVYYPARRLNEIIAESKAKTGIM